MAWHQPLGGLVACQRELQLGKRCRPTREASIRLLRNAPENENQTRTMRGASQAALQLQPTQAERTTTTSMPHRCGQLPQAGVLWTKRQARHVQLHSCSPKLPVEHISTPCVESPQIPALLHPGASARTVHYYNTAERCNQLPSTVSSRYDIRVYRTHVAVQ